MPSLRVLTSFFTLSTEPFCKNLAMVLKYAHCLILFAMFSYGNDSNMYLWKIDSFQAQMQLYTCASPVHNNRSDLTAPMTWKYVIEGTYILPVPTCRGRNGHIYFSGFPRATLPQTWYMTTNSPTKNLRAMLRRILNAGLMYS